MSNLGMQVELSMTAKGVQATLKDAQGAVIQTASIIKSQIPAATSEAGKGLAKFKEGLGRSRETMMFFTRSLAEFGPAGQMAQTALSGLGGMLMGGGVVGLGLAAAQIGASLLADALTKESKAAEEAKKKNDEVFKKLIEDAGAAARAVQAFNAKARGIDPEDASLAASSAALNPAIAKAQADIAARRAALSGLQAQQDSGKAYAGQQDDIDAAAKQLDLAERTYEDLLSKQQAFEERRRQIAMTSAVAIENANRAADDQAEAEREAKARARTDKERADYERKYQMYYAHLDRLARAKEKKDADEDRAKAKADAEGQKALDARARKFEAEQEKVRRDAKKTADEYAKMAQSISESVGSAIAGVITGTTSVKEALGSMLKSMVNMLIEAVKTEIMAVAASAAAKSADSQAQIPVVGPYLAAGAMVAMLALVQGLVSSVPSASGGWERVPSDTMAMIHKDEQVLPAKYAEGLRNLVANGGAGGITVNFVTPDAQGVRRFFLDNQSALAEAITAAARNGRLG